MAPLAVRLSGVTRVFGVAPALIRADLSVERGEVLLVRGPNGAGKSTLLRVIATALSPTYGSGSVLGFDLVTGREEIRRRVELLAHRTRLYEDLTARENLRFTSALYGLDAGRIDPVLRDVGLADAAGERALLRSPELLLLDEPYAGLDEEGKDVVDRLMLAAHAEGRTVVLATHDPSRGTAATRTVFMDGGRLLPELRAAVVR